MSTASIQFEAFKETKSGNIKQQVNAVLSMDGEIGIPIKSLSGGERSSVDLAVDFAVIDMIENISGKGIDLFILDEPFTGLDAQNREECLEIIKQNLGKKRVVIVDHSAETKAMVPDKVVVIREGQTSCIKGA
jgi:DNA repair exonuclease SbcCD ATPase subunit